MIWFELSFVDFSGVLVGDRIFLIVVEKNHLWFDFIVFVRCRLLPQPAVARSF